MGKKFTALLIVFITATCFICGCHVEKDKPVETVAAVTPTLTPTPEIGNDTDITTAGFDIDTIKAGDKISVFTVTSADIKKYEDGTLLDVEIKFTGSFAVRGTYRISEDADSSSCFFEFTDEYADYLPFPRNVVSEFDGFYIDVSKIQDIYGDGAEETAAIVIEEYSVKYSSEDGEWKANAGSFSKDENEYAIMQ
ncbi:MAG: hypothetical protein IJZ94_01780 [Clostridia bacterium]|nr:hypothetical protein [Clostridia bacterium]